MFWLYAKYFGVVILGAGLIICIVAIGCFFADAYRYRRALRRNQSEIDKRDWR